MPEWPSNTEDSIYLSAFLTNTLSLYYKFPFIKIITWFVHQWQQGPTPGKIWEENQFEKKKLQDAQYLGFRLQA